MPYTFSAVDKLLEQPLIASATCVDLVRLFVTGLAGKPTSSWKQGVGVMEAHRAGTVIPKGTAIATFEQGCYLPRCASMDAGRCHHAALLLQATPDGIWVMDQYTGAENRQLVTRRFIRVPPPRAQLVADGSYCNAGNNAFAFSVIEL